MKILSLTCLVEDGWVELLAEVEEGEKDGDLWDSVVGTTWMSIGKETSRGCNRSDAERRIEHICGRTDGRADAPVCPLTPRAAPVAVKSTMASRMI